MYTVHQTQGFLLYAVYRYVLYIYLHRYVDASARTRIHTRTERAPLYRENINRPENCSFTPPPRRATFSRVIYTYNLKFNGVPRTGSNCHNYLGNYQVLESAALLALRERGCEVENL
jgi:hypothetical protein